MFETGDDPLAALQNDFFDYILDRSDTALTLIKDDRKVGAEKRMGIYHHAYRASLVNVLADHFERLSTYLGDEQFGQVAREYIASNPSKVRNLRYYGERFPAFLAARHPQDPELAELAQLDWHLRHAFDAADTQALSGPHIGALGENWPEILLALHPSAALMEARHNIIAIWTALDGDTDVPECESLAEPVPILIWRKEMQPHFRSLSRHEFAVLSLFNDGASFESVSEYAADILGESAAIEILSQWLAGWLADGLIIENPRNAA